MKKRLCCVCRLSGVGGNKRVINSGVCGYYFSLVNKGGSLRTFWHR